MQERLRIVLYGNSMFIAGVAAGLRNIEKLDIVWVPAANMGMGEQLCVSYPDAVVMELNDSQAAFAIAFLRNHPGVPLIGLDLESNRVFVLYSHCSTATDVHELAHMIQMQFTTMNNPVLS